MKEKMNVYKVIFWIVTGILALMIIGFTVLTPIGVIGSNMSKDDQTALFVIGCIFALMITILAIIGLVVYKDAKKHGMDPWLWLLIVVYAPNGVGIVIYLIVRYSEKKKDKCPTCGYLIEKGFAVCPQCGNKLKSSCIECGKVLETDWKVCPYCKHIVEK